LLALSPLAALVALGVWLIVVLPTRIVSLASVLAAVTLPVAFYVVNPTQFEMVVPLAALAIVVAGRHNENIERLLKGEEKRFGSSSKSSRAPEQAEANDQKNPGEA
jgi:glycerol-3-phosphate acyltransferase PlsY